MSQSSGAVATVLVASGAIGFVLGGLWRPSWQDAIEPAQVLAGLVHYPPDNPVYIYSVRTWTVLHQAIAALLACGVPERAMAVVVSGATGMLSLQALALVVLAVGGEVALAILAPVFILVTESTRGGVTYPVYLMGMPFSYGVVGLSYLLLAMALIGSGQARWGALLLGFGPAVHPTIGFWGLASAAAALAFTPRRLRDPLARCAPYLFAGLTATAVSASVHVLWATRPPIAATLEGILQHWDEHRQPFPLLSFSTLTTAFAAAVQALWLWRFRRDVPEPAHVLLGMLVATAALGGALSASYWIVPPDVPSLIPALMPSRLLNVNVLACMALLIGLTSRYRSSVVLQSTFTLVVVTLLGIVGGARVPDLPSIPEPWILAWVGAVVCGTMLLVTAERRHGRGETSEAPASPTFWLRGAAMAAMAATLAVVLVVALRGFGAVLHRDLADRTNDPVFAAAAARPGLLLTAANLHMMQGRTRRPVLLDGGALDSLVYVPEASREADRILKSVYGTDVGTIQRSRLGYLPDDAGRNLWHRRRTEEWQQIAREFGVTDVLTPTGWVLDLPVLASNGEVTLYTIPGAGPTAVGEAAPDAHFGLSLH
jgi:hypothetical protein